jgi:DmsE family decaheme c-type cytochrome
MEVVVRWLLAVPLIVGLGGLALPARAGDRELVGAIAPPETSDEYAGGGITTCIDCHDEGERYPVLSILKTKHALQSDPRTPFASDEGCEVCHGPSAAHEEDDAASPGVLFGPDAPPGPQNEVCLGCHEGSTKINWVGSAHDAEDVTCVSCHVIHTGEDPVMGVNSRPDLWVRSDSQAEVCFQCHQQQKAQIHRLSAHPIKEGKASCSSCHNPHGSMGPSLLAKPTLNETCYACHAEKRGPFLWEHDPAREDCSLCHDSHGSNHRPMLKARGPWLCQQCHMASYHPSTAYTGAGVVPNGADDHLLASECRNCHAEVHGSNHPSGVRWTR